MGQTTYIGVGLYTFPEAARIIGIKQATLRRWVRAYHYRSRNTIYHHAPVITRSLGDEEPILTFLELIELLFVKLFRSQGVSMPLIRKAAARAAKRWQTPYPFAVKRFDTDGKYIFATLGQENDNPILLEDRSRGQLVFEEVVRPFFRKLEYKGNADALKFWPMDREGRVVLDPQRAFGKPIDAETGVPTVALNDAVTAGQGQGIKEVAEWFEVPIAAVEAAVEYERSLLAA